jgi:hypothetical protein
MSRVTWRGVKSGLPFLASGAGLLALLPVSLVAFLFLSPVIQELLHERRFDAVAWQRNEARNSSWPARLRMVDDLLKRRALDGLTPEGVVRLLGPRDDTDYFREWDMVYYLGPERGLISIDSEWLVVRFGPDGRVSDYRIVRD